MTMPLLSVFSTLSPNVTQLVELTFTFPISNEIDDALFVPALTRPPSTATPSVSVYEPPTMHVARSQEFLERSLIFLYIL
jgi:hypothetical protein